MISQQNRTQRLAWYTQQQETEKGTYTGKAQSNRNANVGRQRKFQTALGMNEEIGRRYLPRANGRCLWNTGLSRSTRLANNGSAGASLASSGDQREEGSLAGAIGKGTQATGGSQTYKACRQGHKLRVKRSSGGLQGSWLCEQRHGRDPRLRTVVLCCSRYKNFDEAREGPARESG